MSGNSPSELPVHYGDSAKEGSRATRPSVDEERHSGDADTMPIVSKPEKTYRTRDDPFSPNRVTKDKYSRPAVIRDPEESALVQRRNSRRQPASGIDFSRPLNRVQRHSARDRPRYYDYDRFEDYDDDDDEYDHPYRSRPKRYPDPRRSRDPYYDDDRFRYGNARDHRSRYDDNYDDRFDYRRSEDAPWAKPREFAARTEDEGIRFERKDPFEKSPPPKQNHSRISRVQDLTDEEKKEIMRLPWIRWMNSNFKNHFVATLGEFVGTTMFLFFAFAGTQVANIPSGDGAGNSTSGGATGFNPTVLLYISLVFSFSLMVNVWIFFRISGGLFNPAVTFAMFLVKAIPLTRAICLFAAQIAGSVAASALVLATFPTPLNVRTTLSGGASIVQGLFIEALLTFELVFTIFMLAKEKHRATFIAPVGIGLALFIAELCGIFYTGGSLNPARSLGPCIVTNTYDREHWIYWVGPCMGSLFAVGFYWFIKALEYEVANPGQDDGGEVFAVKATEGPEAGRGKVERSAV